MSKSGKKLVTCEKNPRFRFERQERHSRGQESRRIRDWDDPPRRVYIARLLASEPIALDDGADGKSVVDFPLLTGCCHIFDTAIAPIVVRVAACSTVLDGFAAEHPGTWGDPQLTYA